MMNQTLWVGLAVVAGLSFVPAAHGADPSDVARLLQTGKCRGCNLKGADLSRANLRDAELEDANLEAANLTGANLKDADFDRANLQFAMFKDAIIDNTDFSSANLKDARIELQELERGDAKVCNAILPSGMKKDTGVEGFFGFGGCRN
jgi:Pentapeptide repeats (9 copies)